MFVVSAAEGLTAAAAAGGLETSAAVSSSAAAFQRNASTTSVASLHQSFLDAEPADQLRLFTQLRSADGNVKASPAAAAVTSASSSPPPASPSMPQLRTLRGHVGSNTNQAFLDDSDEAAQMQRVGACNGLLNAHVALAGVAKKEENATGGAGVTTSPPPAPPLETRKGCSNPNESNAAVEDDVRYDVFSHASRAAANLSTPLTLTLPQTDFSRQYEHSRNPYLRAAAEEMKASSDDTFQGWGDGDFTGGDDRLGSTSAFVNNAKSRSGHEGVPSSFVLAAHKAPQLTQPFGAPRQRDNTSFREALPATSNVKDDLLSSSGSGAASTLLRGIPLFTRTRQSSRLAASPASSLRQSVEEYGQLQLQNEAVHWYHRSSVLEHQLARLQEMYNRQSKLLAAHWRAEAAAAQPHTTSTRTDTACTDALMKTANADVKEALQRRRPHDASPTPFPVEHRLASAATATASVGSPERRMTELTSRSPDSLPRAYLDEEAMECLSGGVVEAGNGLQEAPFAPRTAKKEAAMANVVLASTPYAAPTPHSEAESGQFESSYSDGASRKAVHAPHSFVRRGEAGTTDTSACTRPTIGVQSSGVGVPTGSSASSFVRQDGEAALHTESAYDAEGASSLPAPSAIIAKQYTEAVTEMEAMQVRLDVAEREAANLREMCVTRDLRCDDLETQLLAKEEQLLRYAQQQQQQGSSSVMERSASLPAGDSSVNGEGRVSSLLKGEPIEACGAESGECLVAPAVQLKPLMAQLTELLVNVRRVQDDYPVDKESLEANDTATPSGKQSPLPTDINYCSARTEHLSLPLSNLEAGGADDATQLSSLVSLVYQAVLKVSQQYAALQAELEVVRADRNELIGEQSEQVRLLQQQLLEKDREQLRLMERVTAADLASRKEADPPEPLKEKSASPVVDDAHDVRDGALSAPLIVPPERAAAEDHSHVLAEQVEKLKVQLAEAKAAAAAAQDAQRNVLTERLERTQTELKQTRLRAEDEYDRLSGTIEMLTRELTDTKEALRIKEVSLRIALRTSSPAMLLAASEEPTGDPASSVCAATATSAPFLTAGLQMTSPLALPPPPVAVQEAAAAATTRSDREDENRRQYSLRTSPSPPPAPLSPSHLRIIVEAEESNGVATVSQSDRASRATSSPPPSPLHHRGKKFVDDGTLRTLPSSVLTEAEGEDSENERLRAARFAVSSSSREKSSRGLTTSTGVESHTPSSSLPRGRSSSSGGGIADSALEHVQSTLTAVRSEGTEQATRNTISGSAGELLSSAVDGAPSGVRESATRQDAALAASPWAKSATGVRRSASARLADALVEEEEELPLPLPLRGPLFRPLPSSLSTASTSLSPHSPHPMESTRAGFRSNTSTSLLPLNSEPQRRQTPRQLSTPSLSLEERLRNFLNSSAGIAAAALDKTAAITGVNQVSASPATRRQTERTSEPDTPISTFKDEQAEMTGHVGARLAVPEDGATPARTPISLLSERMSSTPLWAASTPSSRFGGSPHVSEVAARHTQASLRRHREVWQQQESLLESLLSSPSP